MRAAVKTWGRGLGLMGLAVLPAEWWGGSPPNLGVRWLAEALTALVAMDFLMTAIHAWWHRGPTWLHSGGPHHAVPEERIDWHVGQVWGPWEPLMGVPTVWLVIVVGGVPLGPAVFAAGTMLCFALWVHTEPRAWHRRIGWLFVTPASHRVHHSADPALYGRNCGFVFSVWDRLFGTYRAP